MLALLRRHRPFSIFLATQVASNLGDAVTSVVVPLMVLQLTRSPALVAAVALLETIPHLVLKLPFGALLDRRDRRRTMLFADLARAAITLAVPLKVALHGQLLLVLFAVAVPLGVSGCLFGAGFGAITPSLAGRERVAAAYALVEGGESLAWIGGPMLAALLVVTIGGAGALAVDALTFLVSALGLALIPSPARPEAEPRTRSLRAEVMEGLRFLAGNAVLRRAQLSWTLYTAIGCGGVVAGLVYVGSAGGAGRPALSALAVAAYAAGSTLGTIAAGWRRPPSPWLGIAASLAGLAAGAALVATGLVPAVLVGALLFGLGEGFFLVVYLTVRAEATPDELMGRIAGAAGLLGQVAGGVGVAWMGLALQWLGGTAAFGMLAALALLLAGWVVGTRPRSVAPAWAVMLVADRAGGQHRPPGGRLHTVWRRGDHVELAAAQPGRRPAPGRARTRARLLVLDCS